MKWANHTCPVLRLINFQPIFRCSKTVWSLGKYSNCFEIWQHIQIAQSQYGPPSHPRWVVRRGTQDFGQQALQLVMKTIKVVVLGYVQCSWSQGLYNTSLLTHLCCSPRKGGLGAAWHLGHSRCCHWRTDDTPLLGFGLPCPLCTCRNDKDLPINQVIVIQWCLGQHWLR